MKFTEFKKRYIQNDKCDGKSFSNGQSECNGKI